VAGRCTGCLTVVVVTGVGGDVGRRGLTFALKVAIAFRELSDVYRPLDTPVSFVFLAFSFSLAGGGNGGGKTGGNGGGKTGGKRRGTGQRGENDGERGKNEKGERKTAGALHVYTHEKPAGALRVYTPAHACVPASPVRSPNRPLACPRTHTRPRTRAHTHTRLSISSSLARPHTRLSLSFALPLTLSHSFTRFSLRFLPLGLTRPGGGACCFVAFGGHGWCPVWVRHDRRSQPPARGWDGGEEGWEGGEEEGEEERAEDGGKRQARARGRGGLCLWCGQDQIH